MGVYLKIPSNGVPTGRINYESDFIVKIILNKKVGDRDFKIDFLPIQPEWFVSLGTME